MPLWKKLFSFDGRLRRRDYWILGLSAAALQLLCAFVVTRAAGTNLIDAALAAAFTPGWFAINAASLPFIWPSFAISVKRGHDRGIAAIGIIALSLGPYVSVFGPYEPGSPMELFSNGLLITSTLIAVVLLGILDGTPGSNRYGLSPKGKEQLSQVFG